jgi:hypothetical protein
MSDSVSSESEMVIHRKNYTIKIVRSKLPEALVDPEIPRLVVSTLDDAIKILGLQNEYLLAIIVPGDHVTGIVLDMDEEEIDEESDEKIKEGQPEHSLYMSSLDTLVIAGVVPKEVKRDDWLKGVRKSLIQDVILHWAYTNGSYGGEDDDYEYLEYLMDTRLKEFSL